MISINTRYGERLSSEMLNEKVHVLAGGNFIISGFKATAINDTTVSVGDGKCIIKGAIISTVNEGVEIQIPVDILTNNERVAIICRYIHENAQVYFNYTVDEITEENVMVLATVETSGGRISSVVQGRQLQTSEVVLDTVGDVESLVTNDKNYLLDVLRNLTVSVNGMGLEDKVKSPILEKIVELIGYTRDLEFVSKIDKEYVISELNLLIGSLSEIKNLELPQQEEIKGFLDGGMEKINNITDRETVIEKVEAFLQEVNSSIQIEEGVLEKAQIKTQEILDYLGRLTNLNQKEKLEAAGRIQVLIDWIKYEPQLETVEVEWVAMLETLVNWIKASVDQTSLTDYMLQIIDIIGKLDELATDDKESIVSAINELKLIGGAVRGLNLRSNHVALVAEKDNQHVFNLPIDTHPYLKDNGNITLHINSTYLKPTWYEIEDNVITIYPEHEGVELGKALDVTYFFLGKADESNVVEEFYNTMFDMKTVQVTIEQDDQREIIIPMDNYTKERYQFMINVGSTVFSASKYTIRDNKVILNEDTYSFKKGKVIEFVFFYTKQVAFFQPVVDGELLIDKTVHASALKDGTISRTKLDEDLTHVADQALLKDEKPEVSVADVEIKGRTLVNLLGRTGNAIYQQDWIISNATLAFSNDQFVINVNTSGYIQKNIPTSLNAYYVFVMERTDGIADIGGFLGSSEVIDKASDHGIIRGFKATGTSAGIVLGCRQANVDGKCKYVRCYQVTQSEYSSLNDMTADEIIARYPYVDDVKCVVNPYIESKENLLDGAIFTPNTVCSYGKIAATDDSKSFTSGRLFECQPNTTYTIYNPYSFPVHVLFEKTDAEWSSENELIEHEVIGKRTVTTTVQNGVMIYFAASSQSIADEIAYTYSNITLVKGVEAKTHDRCNNSRIMFETKLYDGETISKTSDGIYVKNSEWEEFTLQDDQIQIIGISAKNVSEGTGHKKIALKIPNVKNNYPYVISYNGSIVYRVGDISTNGISGYVIGKNLSGYAVYIDGVYSVLNCNYTVLELWVPNTLTGWGDSYFPTQEEIKAFFLGWTMYEEGTSGGIYSSASTGAKKWAMLYSGIGTGQLIGNGRCQIAGGNTAILPTVMNDMGYTPYRLIYKKEIPTIQEVKAYGGLVVKDGVDIVANSGLVLSEEVNYQLHTDGLCYVNGTFSLIKNRLQDCLKIYDSTGNSYSFINYYNQTRESHITKGSGYSTFSKSNSLNSYVDYLVFRPDTVISYDYITKPCGTAVEKINKHDIELTAIRESLAVRDNKLKHLRDDLSQRSNPNLLINGDFSINQRGESEYIRNIYQYTLDRWAVNNSQSKVSVKDGYVRVENNNSIFATFGQTVELSRRNIKSDKLTISFFIRDFKSAENHSMVRVYFSPNVSSSMSGTVYDVSRPIRKGYNSVTIDIPQKDFNSFTVYIYTGQPGANSSNTTYFEVEWMKAELGEYATPFVPRTYAEELAMCQRYYEKVKGVVSVGSAVSGSTNYCSSLPFLVEKRILPTIKYTQSPNLINVKMVDVSYMAYNSSELTKAMFEPVINLNGTPFAAGMKLIVWADIDAEIY